MRDEISALACKIFDEEELKEINEIELSCLSKSDEEFRHSLSRLRYVIPSRPKRPMYYIHHLVGFLPEETRFVVEQTGSYLDLLVKEFRFELEGTYHNKSLGTNLHALSNLIDKTDTKLEMLLDNLMHFNNDAYVPSKHVYGSPNDDKHFFDEIDAITIALVGVKLGEELKKRSQYVRNFAQDLVLPGQRAYFGKHTRTDNHGIPFDFKSKLMESKDLVLDHWGRPV